MSTRECIRKLAWQMIGQGRWPTTTLIQIAMGSGSKSTIVSELRQWTAEALSLLVAAKRQADSPPPNTVSLLEAENTELKGRLEEARAQLTQAYDRFESFENRMLIEVDKVRHEHLPLLEKAKRELALQKQDFDRVERKLLDQARTLSSRLAEAGLDAEA